MTPVLRVKILALAGAFGIAGLSVAAANEVNIYTYREGKLIQPLFDAFSKDTGIKVNSISSSSGLEQRIKTEGANSPADVLLTVDIGRLEEAVQSRAPDGVRYVGRTWKASPSEGYPTAHHREQDRIVRQALGAAG